MSTLADPKKRYGKRGKKIDVATNSFTITNLPSKTWYQYDVVISPEIRQKRRKNELIDRLQTVVHPNIFTPRALYDGESILFSSNKLELGFGDKGSFDVSFTSAPNVQPRIDGKGVYKVSLTLTTGTQVSPQDLHDFVKGGAATAKSTMAINILQMLVRAAPNMKYPNNGRAFFSDYGRLELPGGFELWRGYFQSVRPTMGRMLVNVDVSVSAVYQSGNLLDVAMKVLNLRNTRDLTRLSEEKLIQLNKHFKNILVHISPARSDGRKRIKTIRSFIPEGGKFVFQKDTGEVTVKDHYFSAYGITLKFPDAPGIVTTGKNAPSPVVIPMELCDVVPGQLFRKKLPDHLTADMVRFSNLKPDKRLQAIVKGASDSDMQSPVMNYATSDFIRNADMSIADKPLTISGRLLNTPALVYGGANPTQIRNGAWNVQNQRFNVPRSLQGAKSEAWGVVVYSDSVSADVCRQFVDMLVSCCNKLGMAVEKPLYLGQGNGQTPMAGLDQAAKYICEHGKVKSPRLILVILPKNGLSIKSAVKTWGDIRNGVITQCVREDKISNRGRYVANDQYCNNLALKFNARLGGSNNIIRSPTMQKLGQSPYMIMGADCGHPGPNSTRPSATSIVWSVDQNATVYRALSNVQVPRQEIIEDLQKMVEFALNDFGQTVHVPPKRIIFFRDGISEGEYVKVSAIEIGAIKAACEAMWKEHKVTTPLPKLTFLAVGKRHHVRFFPKQPSDADRSGNLNPGFVADEGIGSPLVQDFFLQSQGGLQGTSRPAHYVILHDENFEHNVDDLQELSFSLCHVYAKATRSISYPAPVYYADLVCSRIPYYFDNFLTELDNASLASGNQGASFDLEPWKKAYKGIHQRIRQGMYFL